MRDVVIKAGVYGRRDEKGRVLPVAKGDRVDLPDEEAARLVALDIAAYVDAPAQAPGMPPAPPPVGGPCPLRAGAAKGGLTPGGGEEPGMYQDTPGEEPPAEAATGAEKDGLDAAEVKRLERMPKGDLEQMAQDMGIDISEAKNNHERAELIVAAGEPEDGDDPPELGAGDIVP